MKEIQLQGGAVAMVDDEDFERLNRFRWRVKRGKHDRYPYALRKRLANEPKCPYHIRMHRAVLGLVWNLPLGLTVDHVNRNGLDNRKENLRVVTDRVNAGNRHDASRHGTGVRLVPSPARPYEARAWDGGKYRLVGRFPTAQEARSARQHFLEANGLAMPVSSERDSKPQEILQGAPFRHRKTSFLRPGEERRGDARGEERGATT